jgi:metal-responsive CopG/Arc/MetJ family transcriptional regulator
MKTAISLPDRLFKAGNALAKRLGVSRSQLYSQALEEYLAKNRADRVTERLNAVYSKVDSRMDPALMAAQMRALPPEKW